MRIVLCLVSSVFFSKFSASKSNKRILERCLAYFKAAMLDCPDEFIFLTPYGLRNRNKSFLFLEIVPISDYS